MKSLLEQTEQVLREVLGNAPPASLRVTRLAGLTLGCGLFYGLVMGSFGGVTGDRAWQLVYSGVKVPLLLLATFALSLPSFFVLNTLLGLRADFALVVRALLGSQAALAIVLAALAPYTALWYASSASYVWALLCNGLMFAVASVTAQGLLRRAYRPLRARHRQHGRLLQVWLVLYAFVGIQLAWVLRPFVGEPGLPVQFFREGAWGNAYVVVGRLIGEAFLR